MPASSAFEEALSFTLGPDVEGGLANVSGDRGGFTNHGITQKTYDAWRATTGQPLRSVGEIEDGEIRAIYLADFWIPCNCDSLPPMLALAVFDMAVTSGPWNAKLTLQRAVHVQQDGVIGPATVAAAERTPSAVLEFLKARAGFNVEDVQAHPEQIKFLHGWFNRNLSIAWIAARA